MISKIKRNIDLVIACILPIILIFSRESETGLTIVTVGYCYLLFKKIIDIIKNPLPKPSFYIKNRYVRKIMAGMLVIMSGLVLIESIIQGRIDEFALINRALFPMWSCIFLDRLLNKTYFYKDGLVIDEEIYYFDKIKAYNWKADEPNFIQIEYENKKIDVYIPKKKIDEVEEILLSKVSLE